MTLIEVVVSIAIIGLVGLGASLYLVQLSDMYVGSRTETVEASRFTIALEQMARELTHSLPATIQIQQTPASIQFDRVLTGGVAAQMRNGTLVDRLNPDFDGVAPGMVLLLRPFDRTPARLNITSVNGRERALGVRSLTDQFVSEYWVLRSRVRFAFEDGTIVKQFLPAGTASVLCDGVNAFHVSRGHANLLHLSLRGNEQESGRRITIRKTVVR